MTIDTFVCDLKAVQMWVLARYLPVLVGKYITTDDCHWKNFLTLLHITDFIIAPKITTDEVAYLNVLIQEHLSLFVTLYPTAPVIPKQHYLLHSATLISR